MYETKVLWLWLKIVAYVTAVELEARARWRVTGVQWKLTNNHPLAASSGGLRAQPTISPWFISSVRRCTPRKCGKFSLSDKTRNLIRGIIAPVLRLKTTVSSKWCDRSPREISIEGKVVCSATTPYSWRLVNNSAYKRGASYKYEINIYESTKQFDYR